MEQQKNLEACDKEIAILFTQRETSKQLKVCKGHFINILNIGYSVFDTTFANVNVL